MDTDTDAADADADADVDGAVATDADPRRVRRTALGAAQTVATDDPAILLTDRVLVGVLTPAIAAVDGVEVRSVRVDVVDEAVIGVSVDLSGRYGVSLVETAGEVRSTAARAVRNLVGAPVPAELPIDVQWVDVQWTSVQWTSVEGSAVQGTDA